MTLCKPLPTARALGLSRDRSLLSVLMNHLRASTFELPVPAAERFGLDETPMLLDVLQDDGWIRRADDDRFYWSHENFPASDFSLRTGAPENVVIVDTTGDRHRVLGELKAAEGAFVHAAECLEKGGTGDPRILAEILSLEASLRLDQRRLEESLALMDRAINLHGKLGDRPGLGKAFLQKAKILQESFKTKTSSSAASRRSRGSVARPRGGSSTLFDGT